MKSTWSRRGALRLLAGAVVARSAHGAGKPSAADGAGKRAAIDGAARDTAGATIDFANAELRNRVYVQLRARTDGAPTYMPYRATLYGRLEGRPAVPLFQVNGFSIARATKLGPARWRLDGVEAGYYGDPETGEPLEQWTNPLNGRECRVKHYRSFQHLDLFPDRIAPVVQPHWPAMQVTASMGTPSQFNGQVWMHEDLIGSMPNRPKESFADVSEYAGPTLAASSLATFSAAVSDVLDERRAFVPTMFSYQTMNSWRPFMRMGETPGMIAFRMFGAKAETLDGVPKSSRERVLADYPDFLTRTAS